MDQQPIDVIEGYLGITLIRPAAIDEIDAKEIAAALAQLDEERITALEGLEGAWGQPEVQDEINRERLSEVTDMLEEVIAHCGTCTDDQRCGSCELYAKWLSEA